MAWLYPIADDRRDQQGAPTGAERRKQKSSGAECTPEAGVAPTRTDEIAIGAESQSENQLPLDAIDHGIGEDQRTVS